MEILGRLLVMVLFATLCFVVGVVVAYGMADDKTEPLLILKLIGYGILGWSTLNIGGFPLPAGFLIALWLASRCQENRSSRQIIATATGILWFLGFFMGEA
jgi:hypothetical protein